MFGIHVLCLFTQISIHIADTLQSLLQGHQIFVSGQKIDRPMMRRCFFVMFAAADPGFPVGGRQPRRGGANSRGGYVSKNLYVKMKESGPVGGVRAGGAPWIRHWFALFIFPNC